MTHSLIQLILSLTKSEKRNFKIYANKMGSHQKLYLLLFDWIEKHEDLSPGDFLSANPRVKKTQIPNIKASLFNHLLSSLREINKDVYLEIQAREQFDFAKVLYSKGQYKAALRCLQKAKKLAENIKNDSLVFLALDFEKHIEIHHITGSSSTRAKELALDSSQLVNDIELTNDLSNLSLLLYGRYLRFGFIRNQHDYKKLQDFFYNQLPAYDESKLTFKQSMFLYQSFVWYYYMAQNFAYNYRYAQKWVTLFHENAQMIAVDTANYLKALHNVLSSLFIAEKQSRFIEYYDKLIAVKSIRDIHFNVNESSLLELYTYIHGINKIIVLQEYHEDISLVEQLIEKLDSEEHNWARSRIIVFHYKIACIYFGREEYEKAIYWLNKIINNSYGKVKQDIQSFARILSLITHYEMGNDLLISYQIISVYRFLLKMKDLGRVQREIFIFLRRSSKVNRKSLDPEFLLLKRKLESILQDPYSRRPFLYLDIIAWLESKLKGISMVEAIKDRRMIS